MALFQLIQPVKPADRVQRFTGFDRWNLPIRVRRWTGFRISFEVTFVLSWVRHRRHPIHQSPFQPIKNQTSPESPSAHVDSSFPISRAGGMTHQAQSAKVEALWETVTFCLSGFDGTAANPGHLEKAPNLTRHRELAARCFSRRFWRERKIWRRRNRQMGNGGEVPQPRYPR